MSQFSPKNFAKPYVIAEIGANHNGDMGLAKALIDAAKESGADCVKFQSWTKDSVFSRSKYQENCFLHDDYANRTDHTLESIVEAYSFSEAQLLKAKEYCQLIDIDFASTPFSKREVDFLVEDLLPPFIKIASMDLNNYPFVEYIAKKQRPIVISTGFSELSEIDRAVKVIENSGNRDISILHCVSTYPPRDADINLRAISTLQALYPEYAVGFSDHSIGIDIPLASMAFGVAIVEKHFTLDKNMEGWDHKVSATPDELRQIVNGASRIYNAIGNGTIRPTETTERKKEFRRSIVLARPLKKGSLITEQDLEYKRPGTGLSPEWSPLVLGLKVKRDLEYDHILSKEDLE